MQCFVTPYIWLSGIDTTTKTPLPRRPEVNSDVSAIDLLSRAVLPVAHGKPQRAEPIAMDAQKPDNGARRRRSPANVGPNLPARQPWRD
jgi:hypothetical protein